jgi:hypothetical protein
MGEISITSGGGTGTTFYKASSMRPTGYEDYAGPECLIEFGGKVEGEYRTLLRVMRDCSVEIPAHVSVDMDAASRLFWEMVAINGKALLARAEAAEARLAALTASRP